MSLSFTIKPKTSDLRTFEGISLTNGRQAIDFDPGAAHQLQFRFHSPGVDGNFLIRDASVGRSISVVVRYMSDSLANAELLYAADRNVFTTEACTITALSQVFYGCNLRPESMRRSTPMRPTGRTSGQVFFNVSMVFTQDNPGDL